MDKLYDKFKQLADKLSQKLEEEYLCEWFKKGLLPWIHQQIVIRGVKTLNDILTTTNDIIRELSVKQNSISPATSATILLRQLSNASPFVNLWEYTQ